MALQGVDFESQDLYLSNLQDISFVYGGGGAGGNGKLNLLPSSGTESLIACVLTSEVKSSDANHRIINITSLI